MGQPTGGHRPGRQRDRPWTLRARTIREWDSHWKLPGRAPSLGPDGASWSMSDIIVFGDEASGRIMRVSAGGGTPAPVTAQPPVDRRHVTPFFLPDGKRFLFADLSDSRRQRRPPDGAVGRRKRRSGRHGIGDRWPSASVWSVGVHAARDAHDRFIRPGKRRGSRRSVGRLWRGHAKRFARPSRCEQHGCRHVRRVEPRRPGRRPRRIGRR